MYTKLNKKAMWCMFVNSVIALMFLGLFLSIVWVAADEYTKNTTQWIIHLIVIIIAIIDLLVVIFSPKIRYMRYRYCITNEKIDIVEGFLFIERNIVPIERLHKISINQGPIDRIFKLAKVIVTTAGGDVTIRFLEVDKAEEIAENLKNKINIIAKDCKNEVTRDGEQ